MRIAEAVAKILKERSTSPTELARQTGIPLADLVDALFGARNLDPVELLRICDALDVSVDSLWADYAARDQKKNKNTER